MKEDADRVKVDEKDGGENRESNRVDDEEDECVFLLDPVNRVDLSPISCSIRCLPHRCENFKVFFFGAELRRNRDGYKFVGSKINET